MEAKGEKRVPDKNIYLSLLTYFVSATLISFLLYVLIPKTYLKVSDQPKGVAVKISDVSLSHGGFIVIVPIDPLTNLPKDIDFLNYPEYIPTGTYKNVNVSVDEGSLIPFSRVQVILYKDSDDSLDFNFESISDNVGDKPFKGLNGEIVRKIINIH